MKKRFCLSGLALAILGLGVVHGQDPTSPPNPVMTPPASPPAKLAPPTSPPSVADPMPATTAATANAGPPPASEGVSSWLAYPRPGCCGEVGRCGGAIDSELFLRSGSSVPVGGGLFGSVMKPGWDFEVGVRVLLFNKPEDAAWTAELGLTNTNYVTTTKKQAIIDNYNSLSSNGAGGTNTTVIPEFPVTPRGLNNTTVDLSLGREFYLWGNGAPSCKTKEPSWRAGFDIGGRWGSSKLDLEEILHKTATVGGMFASIHTDVDIPCGCCIIFAGVAHGVRLSLQ